MSKMIIYFYLFIPLVIPSADSSSIRGKNVKNDLVPFLSSRTDPLQKDNSLKIVSNEPFIIQLQVPDSSEGGESQTGKGKEKKRKPQKKLLKKRDPKIKSIRKKLRRRRDVDDSNFKPRSEELFTDDVTKPRNPANETSTHNSIGRQEVFRALAQITSKKNKQIKDDGRDEEGSRPDNQQNGITYRLHLPPSDRIPIVKMVYPATPKLHRAHKYTYKDLVADRERLEQKIKYIKNMINPNETAGDDNLRVRRKTDQDKTANKIAKMFLTLSAVNGLHDRRKPRCKEDEEDSREDVWEKERKKSQTKRSSSSNEERYKVKKWIEFMKSKRSSKTCPCMSANYNEDDSFPLEQKLAKGHPSLDVGGSSEESSESFYCSRRKPGYRNRYSYDDPEGKVKLPKRAKGKFVIPLDDLEVYRSRAKQILQNAEEILDKIKEEEEKRKSTPNILLSQLKELTSRIHGDPRNNENDLIRLIQKNLGWNPLPKSDDAPQSGTLADNVKSFILDPYEKAKALTDESTKKLSSYLLKNLGNLDSAEEPDESRKTTDEVDRKNSQVYQGLEPPKKDEELSSANLAIERDNERKKSSKIKNWADSLSSIFKSENTSQNKGDDDDEEEEEAQKRAKAEEEKVQKRMKEMLKEQEKILNAYTETPNLEPNSEEFVNPKNSKGTVDDKYSLEEVREETPFDRSTADSEKGVGKKIEQPKPEDGQSEENPTKTEIVASENVQVKPSEDNQKSERAENDVTASELLRQPQEIKKIGNKEENRNAPSLSQDYELENDTGVDKVLDFEDLETLKAEIQSREQEIEKETQKQKDYDESSQHTEDPEKKSRNQNKSQVYAKEVLKSKHEPNSQENPSEKVEASSRENEDEDENDVVESMHLIREGDNENAREDDGLNRSEQKEDEENVMKIENEDSNESKSKEETVAEKEGKLDSSETDQDESDEKKGNSKIIADNTSSQDQKVEGMEDDNGKENVQNALVEESEKSFPSEMTDSEKEKIDGLNPPAEEESEDGNEDVIDKEVLGADNPVVQKPIEEESNLDDGKKISDTSKTDEGAEEGSAKDEDEASLKATHAADSETENEPLQETNQDQDNLFEEDTLRTSKAEEMDNQESSETLKGNSGEDTLRETQVSKSYNKEAEKDLDDDDDDEDRLREAKTDEIRNSYKDPDDEDNDESPLQAVNIGKTAKKEAHEEDVDNDDEEAPLKASQSEDEEIGDNDALRSTHGEITQQTSEKDDETPLRAENYEQEINEENNDGTPVVSSKGERMNKESDNQYDDDDEDNDENNLRAENNLDKNIKEDETAELPLSSGNKKQSTEVLIDDEETPLQAAKDSNAESEKESRDETPLREVADESDDGEDLEVESPPLRATNSRGTSSKETDKDDEKDYDLGETLEKEADGQKDRDNDSDNDETPLRLAKTSEEIDPVDEGVESNLTLSEERPNEQLDNEKQSRNENENDESSLRAANPVTDMKEQSESKETMIDAETPLGIEKTNLQNKSHLLKTEDGDLGEEENDENSPLRMAAVDLNNDINEDNLRQQKEYDSDLRAANPIASMENMVSEEKFKDGDKNEALLGEANIGSEEAIGREANADEDLDNQLIAQERLSGSDEVLLRVANLEKALDELEQNELEENESPLRSVNNDGTPLEAVNPDGSFNEEFDDGNESTLRAMNAAKASKNSNEDWDESNDVTPSGGASRKEADEEYFNNDDEETQMKLTKTDAKEAEDNDESLRSAQNERNEQLVEEEESNDVDDETPLRAAKPVEEMNNQLENLSRDDTVESAGAVVEKQAESDETPDEEARLKTVNPTEVQNNQASQERSIEDNLNNRDDEENEGGHDMYLKAANPLEELNTSRYKQGEEDENLSEENDETPLRATNPQEESKTPKSQARDKKEKNQSLAKKKLRPSSEHSLKSQRTRPKSSKGRPLKVPKSIGQIMKDLNGKEKSDITAIENLDPEKIDHIIDKIDEAEQSNIIEDEAVDCQKECACAEKMNTRSRNIGRYEIAKDFLHWMKDLQISRVL